MPSPGPAGCYSPLALTNEINRVVLPGMSWLCGHPAGWREAVRYGRTITQLPGRPSGADGRYLTAREGRGGRTQS